MFRTALRPRWLALLVVVLVLATVMARLGEWQLGRARDRGSEQAKANAAGPVVPLAGLLAPRVAFPESAANRRVEVSGRWDPARQVLVTPRLQDGRSGYWVLTPLRLPDGSGIGVVRGWTPDPGAAAAAASALPSGEVRVEGVLRPGEPAAERSPGQSSGLPPGQLDRIDLVDLIGLWSYPLFTGYVVATAQQPAPTVAGLAAVPPVAGDGGLALQNLSYAVQWWIFAAFGIFFWFRLVRDDHLGVLGGRAVPSTDVAHDPPADADPIREDDPVSGTTSGTVSGTTPGTVSGASP